MNTPQDDEDSVAPWRLTAEQRQQIYEEEEKSRIEKAAPLFSKRTKVVAAVYLLGCLLLYSGAVSAVMDYLGTRTWRLKPEWDLHRSLGEAVITLIRPFLAVVVAGWIVAVPPLLVLGLWSWGADIVRFFKRIANRDDD